MLLIRTDAGQHFGHQTRLAFALEIGMDSPLLATSHLVYATLSHGVVGHLILLDLLVWVFWTSSGMATPSHK